MSIEMMLATAERARDRGAEEEALAAFVAAAQAARTQFAPEFEARAHLGAGAIRHLLGDEKGARASFEEAIGRAMEGGSRLLEADAYYALAMLAFDHGRSKDGHDALLESMALYRDLDGDEAKAKLARAIHAYGEHLAVLGDAKAAREALSLARAMFADLGETALATGVESEIADLARYER